MSSNRKPRRPPSRTRRPGGDRRPPARDRRTSTEGVRLQKVIAAAGIASRRAAEELIEQGRVTVDGEVVRVQGMRVDPEHARVEVDGERVNVRARYVYLMLNKPAGVVSTARDPHGRRTVVDLVKARARVYPVGRLDADTLGLILLTNHGELAHRLTHPRYGIPRVYLAEIAGDPTPAAIRRLERGVRLEDGLAKPGRVRVARRGKTRTHIEVTMTEGRKHEVRRMFETVGHPVERLVRIGFGPLRLGRLASGDHRELSPGEVGALLSAAGL